jgi:hypothetical protein
MALFQFPKNELVIVLGQPKYTVSQTARICKTTPQAIMYHVLRGNLDAEIKPNGGYLIAAVDVMAFYKKRFPNDNIDITPINWLVY